MKESVILVRHGRSQHNVRSTTNLDSPLTEFGILQARIVGKFFASGAMGDLNDHVFHISPFLRCLMTAENICLGAGGKLDGCEFRIDTKISEFLAMGQDSLKILNRCNDFSTFNWPSEFSNDYEHQPEHGEHFLQRMHSAYDSLNNKSIVISHGMPVLTLAMECQAPLQYIPAWDHSINNCSITWIKNRRKKWWGRNLHHETETQDSWLENPITA